MTKLEAYLWDLKWEYTRTRQDFMINGSPCFLTTLEEINEEHLALAGEPVRALTDDEVNDLLHGTLGVTVYSILDDED